MLSPGTLSQVDLFHWDFSESGKRLHEIDPRTIAGLLNSSMVVVKIIAASHDHDLCGVAPGAHDAFEAGGADAHPDGGAGGEAAEGGFAAAEHPGVFPVCLHVGIADASLHVVHAVRAAGQVARDDRPGQIALPQPQISRRGGRGSVRRARGAVGREPAGIDDDRIASGHDIHVVAQIAQYPLQFVPGDGEGDDVGAGAAGAGGQLHVKSVDRGLQRGHGDRRRGERGGRSRHAVVDVLGDGSEFSGDVAGEIDDGFDIAHRFCAGFDAVPEHARIPAEGGRIPSQRFRHEFGFILGLVLTELLLRRLNP